MSGIRDNRYILDSARVFRALIDSFTDCFSDCDVIFGELSENVFKELTNKTIYILRPKPQGQLDVNHFGGLKKRGLIMTVGFWLNDIHGGDEELQVLESAFYNTFENPQTLYSKTFTVELGGVTYSNKTLSWFGITVLNLGPFQEIPDTINNYRAEIEIEFTV